MKKLVVHVSGFFESVDQTLDNLAALSDPSNVTRASGDNLLVPGRLGNIAACRFGSANMERARFQSAFLRRKALPDISPVGIIEPESPIAGFHEWWDNPIQFTDAGSEQLQALIENDAAAGAENAYGVVWFTDKPVKPDPKGWVPVRFTLAAAAVTASAWTNRSMTLAQNLPPGQYEVGGMRLLSTSLIAARLVFDGQPERPGVTGIDANGDIQPQVFRYGGMGVLGRFPYDQPPSVDLLCNAADNETQEGVLDVRKVG